MMLFQNRVQQYRTVAGKSSQNNDDMKTKIKKLTYKLIGYSD